MEVFTRLISEGVFIYWNDNKNSDSYVVKLYILNADEENELFSEEITGNRHCFSADKLGSGEYQVEVSSFLQGQLVEKVNKKVNLLSTDQRLIEIKEAIDEIKNAFGDVKKKIDGIKNDTSDIFDALCNPKISCNADSWAEFIFKVKDLIRDMY